MDFWDLTQFTNSHTITARGKQVCYKMVGDFLYAKKLIIIRMLQQSTLLLMGCRRARIGHHKIMVHDFVLANIFGNNASASFILWTSQGLSPSLCRRVIFCANGWLNSPMWIGTGTLDQHPSLNSLLLPKAWHSLGRRGGPETSALWVLRGTPPHILQNWRFLGC